MKNKLDRINGRCNIAEDSEDITSEFHITRHKEKQKVKVSEYGKTSLSVIEKYLAYPGERGEY